MKMKKFELTTDTKMVYGRKLFRIKALVSFGNITAGDLGGYVEKEENLSHDGNAWVFGNAKVSDNAKVSGEAKVSGNAEVSGNAWVSGNAKVSGNAEVSGEARVFGNTLVSGEAKVFGEARVSGEAWVSGEAKVFGEAKIFGNARVFGEARVSGNAKVSGNAWVFGEAIVSGNTDYLCFTGPGSCNRNTTFFKCRDGHIHVSCGCFSGTLPEFENKVKETHGDSKYGKEYLACLEVVKIHFE